MIKVFDMIHFSLCEIDIGGAYTLCIRYLYTLIWLSTHDVGAHARLSVKSFCLHARTGLLQFCHCNSTVVDILVPCTYYKLIIYV